MSFQQGNNDGAFVVSVPIMLDFLSVKTLPFQVCQKNVLVMHWMHWSLFVQLAFLNLETSNACYTYMYLTCV